jgi:hypothetical protein
VRGSYLSSGASVPTHISNEENINTVFPTSDFDISSIITSDFRRDREIEIDR